MSDIDKKLISEAALARREEYIRRWNSGEFREKRYRRSFLERYKDNSGMLLFLNQLWHSLGDPEALARLIGLYRDICPELLSELFFKSDFKLYENETINRLIRVTLCSGNKVQGELFRGSSPDSQGGKP